MLLSTSVIECLLYCPLEQEITSLVVSSYDGEFFLEWTLLTEPLADEHFTVKLTEQTANDVPITLSEMDILCNETCRAEKQVFYQLTDINTNSLYFAEVIVINIYGESSMIYIFGAQENLDFLQQNSFSIILAMGGVILLFIIIVVVAVSIFMGWCCAKKCRGQSAPNRIRPGELQMYPRRNRMLYDHNDSIGRRESHCYTETNMNLIRNTEEPTYAHVNELFLARDERDAEPHDYEIYEVMTPIATKKENFSNVSCVRYVYYRARAAEAVKKWSGHRTDRRINVLVVQAS